MPKMFQIALILVFVLVSFVFAEDFFMPFMQKAAEPVLIDGVLDEWNFCFPVDMNSLSIPDDSRCYDWIPDDDFDLSGKVYLMWDDDFLYLAANVQDDVPGVVPQPPGWRADAIELYLGNYDVGNVPWDPNGDGTTPDDAATGKYACQLAFYYDAIGDTCAIQQWTPVGRSLKSELTTMKTTVWPSDLGYTMEARVAWADLVSPNGNTFELEAGMIIPMTFSLYDVDDESDGGDFAGYAFSERDFPAYQGPGKGWQVMEVRGERATPYYKDSTPLLKQAKEPIFVDGDLTDWNFCFPVSMQNSAIPDYSRSLGWGVGTPDPDDCSGELMFMFDEAYLYFAGAVRDDVPGVVASPTDWAADAIEIYIGNVPLDFVGDIQADYDGKANSGSDLDLQIVAEPFIDIPDSSFIRIYYTGGDKFIYNEDGMDTKLKVEFWEDEDGYNIEGRISLADIATMVDEENGERTFDFVGSIGDIWPATYSIYDVDDWDDPGGDFHGFQYVSNESAPWMGPKGGGWEGVELAPKNLYDVLGDLWVNYTDVEENVAPETFALAQNYPNPFNPSTTIEFSLAQAENVTLIVYDALGQEVATLVNEYRQAGSHQITFDAANLPSGMYIYKLQTASQISHHKMLLLK